MENNITGSNIDNGSIKDAINFNNISKESFPYWVFPRQQRALIEDLNKNCGYPIAVTSVALLSACGLALGNFIELYINSEWQEAGNLFACIVDEKGSGKSHAIKTIFKPLYLLERVYYKKFQVALTEWNRAKDEAKANKEPFNELEPKYKRLSVDSATIEKLVEIINENPHGLIVINDELRSWFKSFSQYDTDSLDKWLKMFNRSGIVVDRIMRGTTKIEKPFISVIGTIQPEVLNRFMTVDFKECGLMDRILFTTIETELKFTEGEPNLELINEWSKTFYQLLSISEGFTDSIHIQLSLKAKESFRAWKIEEIKILNNDEDKRILGGKWDNFIYRFALILHCLENPILPSNKEVSEETFNKAIVLVKYFQAEYYDLFGDKDIYQVRKLSEVKRKVYSELSGEFATGEGVRIAESKGLKERTFKSWLNDKSYFKLISYGKYQKTISV